MIYLILALIISILVNVTTIKAVIGSKKENKILLIDLEKLNESMKKSTAAENKKTNIRNKYNDQENNINNTDGVTNVMPNNSKEHNHPFRSPCGKGCPAYSGD